MVDYVEELQRVLLEIAFEVKRICEKHNFQYFLIGGTLLGAVRHKGFIPWDDDFDIVMPRKDYDSFIQTCSKELKSKYYLHCHETDPEYWQLNAKVRKNGTFLNEKAIMQINTHKGIFVDIYALDNAPNPSNNILIIQSKIVSYLSEIIYRKRGLDLGVAPKIRMKITLLLVKALPIKIIAKLQRRIMTLYNDQSTSYWVIYGGNSNPISKTVSKDKYLPYKELEFMEEKFKVPNDFNYILQKIYGDYMLLPSAENRVLPHATEVKIN